jgi:hypothetical protein
VDLTAVKSDFRFTPKADTFSQAKYLLPPISTPSQKHTFNELRRMPAILQNATQRFRPL